MNRIDKAVGSGQARLQAQKIDRFDFVCTSGALNPVTIANTRIQKQLHACEHTKRLNGTTENKLSDRIPSTQTNSSRALSAPAHHKFGHFESDICTSDTAVHTTVLT